MTWNGPTFSIGFIVALVVLIAALLLAVMGQLSKEALMVVAAICAVRL